ncbi:HNH endonuclease signature motif containing protein [Actinomadura latina]|nr:HNH endonuclease signature motif containing protein [Actinomadura latina]
MLADSAAPQREWGDREWFPPGPQLAICLSGGKEHLAELTDAELLQVAAAARRQTSWAQARELAAIAELTERRTRDEADGDPDYRILPARESVAEELAAALTVTGNTAATMVHLAERLTGPLADTGAALEAGLLDFAKARVISDLTDQLPEPVTRRVQAEALPKASAQTTGQLRRTIKRIFQRLAPEAMEERKREAVRQRRLEIWGTPSGTTDLGLCDLAAEDAHAIYNKITAAAHGVRHDGDSRPLNMIRADLATRLLHGLPLPAAVSSLIAPVPADGLAAPSHTDPEHELMRPESDQLAPASDDRSDTAGPHSVGEPALRLPGNHSGTGTPGPRVGAHLQPGPAVALWPHGMVVATEVRVSGYLAGAGGGTGADAFWAADLAGRRLAHVSARVPSRDLAAAVPRTVRRIHRELARAREAACRGDAQTHGRPAYRPPAAMRREIEERHPTCVFPTCNQPSHRCDLDHTVPWRPGITCRCNLAPLCRRHHRLKQSPGWTLHQIWPGFLIWTTPSGAWYIVQPDEK